MAVFYVQSMVDGWETKRLFGSKEFRETKQTMLRKGFTAKC